MEVLNLTSDNFETEVIQSRVPILVDFWATWCGPCRMMESVVEQIAKDMGTNAKVCKVNIDEQRELATKFNVMSIPTFILLQDGKEVGRKVGAMPKEELAELFNM